MELLYKYLPPERESYFQDALLRFTQISDLNDPYECLPKVNQADLEKFLHNWLSKRAQLPSEIEKLPLPDKLPLKWRHEKAIEKTREHYTKDPEFLRRRFFEKYIQSMNEDLGILSFSKRWNSSLMWSHYTSGHQGFCLGFDRAHAFFKRQKNEPIDIGEAVDVLYNKNRPAINIFGGNIINKSQFESKDEDWKYEEEVRIIRRLENAKDRKPTKDPSLPICLFHVPHEALREIICGVRCKKEALDRVLSFGKGHAIPVYGAVLSLESYDLERKLME